MLAEMLSRFSLDGGDRLQQLFVSLSDTCNARCVYCDVHDNVASPEHPADAGRLAAAFAEARDLGCQIVHFMGGGEPLISRQFLPAAARCSELGLAIAITTNGSHLKKRCVALPEQTDLALTLISIDSHIPEVHDQVRHIPGLWRKAVDGVALCRSKFPNAVIVFNHVVTTTNIELLGDFVRWAARAGASCVNLIPVKDRTLLAPTALQALEFGRNLQQLRQIAGSAGIELLFDDADALNWVSEAAGTPTGADYRCSFPRHALYLDLPSGGIFPCDCTVHRKPEERFLLGNLKQGGLADAWYGPRNADLRAILESSCDPGCKKDCDWNNRRTNRALRAQPERIA